MNAGFSYNPRFGPPPRATWSPLHFPPWVVMPEGRPLLTEANFDVSALGTKFGQVFAGSGGGSLVQDNEHYRGGAASLICRTGTSISDSTKVVLIDPFVVNGVVAFEQRWIPANTTNNTWDIGIESRSGGEIVQARLRYTVLAASASGQWKYEDPTQNDVYLAFNAYSSYTGSVPSATALTVHHPRVAAAGDQWGWVRLVVDLRRQEYVRVQAAGENGLFYDVDMRGVPMRNRGGAAGDGTLQFFSVGTTAAASAQDFRTADWCLSELYPTSPYF